jgi:hypothetical protein
MATFPHISVFTAMLPASTKTQARLCDVISPCVRHVLKDGHNLGGCKFKIKLSRVQVVPWVNRTRWEDYTCGAARQGPDKHPRGRGGNDYCGRGSYDEPPRQHRRPPIQEGTSA